VKTIVELSKDIEQQVLAKTRSSPFFAIQCDETTDIANLCQLSVYVRIVGPTSIEDGFLFCRPLETTSKAENVFEVISSFFDKNSFIWENLVGICTDGAPAMIGLRGGFIARMKEKSPNAIGTHCVIHREALASRTLTSDMNDKPAITIKIVNFIKASALNSRLFAKLGENMDSENQNLVFYTAVRWLSKGNMLSRVYNRKEVALFLEDRGKNDLLQSFTLDEFQTALAYLVDIFEAINHLNLTLQGKNSNRLDHYDAIRTFIAKLGLWICRVQKGNVASFP
jgi:hypothetical protein